jgi:hypothetical protein
VSRACNFRSNRTRAWSGFLAVATAVGALLSFTASDAEAYVVKKTSRGDLVHWEERTVGYTIDSSVEKNVVRGHDATLEAMQSWSGTVGAPDLEQLTTTADAPTKPSFDSKNGIFYVKGGYEPAGRALAITVLTYDNASGRILDADVIFNGAYAFEVLAAADSKKVADSITHVSTTDEVVHGGDEEGLENVKGRDTIYDLHHVIAHELGHSLGMNDEMGRRDALMYRYSAPNDATIRQPGSDDIAGLAELYSTKLEARGNGCGNATVAPKKPSSTASNMAMVATLGLLMFLVLRAKRDRRARYGFIAAAAAATIAFVPTLGTGKSSDAGVASASEPISAASLGHARAKVISASTAIENGLFKTQFKLATAECRGTPNSCPKAGYGTTWGGTIGNITQEVGGYYAPMSGDDVDVSFEKTTKPLGLIQKPLAGRVVESNTPVRVITKARL